MSIESDVAGERAELRERIARMRGRLLREVASLEKQLTAQDPYDPAGELTVLVQQLIHTRALKFDCDVLLALPESVSLHQWADWVRRFHAVVAVAHWHSGGE